MPYNAPALVQPPRPIGAGPRTASAGLTYQPPKPPTVIGAAAAGNPNAPVTAGPQFPTMAAGQIHFRPSAEMAPAPTPQQFGQLQAPYDIAGRGRIPGMDVEQQQAAAAQQQLSNILYQQALGGGPSAAQPLLQSAMENAQRQQMQMAASAGPSGYAGALRGAQMQQPQIAAQFGSQAAQLRAGEQQAAQGLLQQNLAGTRGQDLAAQQAAIDALNAGATLDQSALFGAAGVGLGLGKLELGRGELGVTADVAAQNAAIQAAELQAQIEAQRNALIAQLMGAQTGRNEQEFAQMWTPINAVVGAGTGITSAALMGGGKK